MLGFRCKAGTLARSDVRLCSSIAPVLSHVNHGAQRSVNRFDLTVSYFVESCGFPQEAATVAAKKFNIKSTTKADKVLSLFREYGFKNSDLSRLLEKSPNLIAMNPERSLKAKLDILASFVPSHDLLVKVLIRCPRMLHFSLNKTLVPSLEHLRSTLGSDENVLKTIRFSSRLLSYKLPSLLGPNVAMLREVGMPDDLILAFIKDRPDAVLLSPARLKVLVERARDFGFDPKRYGFIMAMTAFSAVSDIRWEQKVKLYKKWGWSDDEVIFAFKRCPQIMMASQKKVDAFMYYFVNTLKLNPSFVAKNSKLLTYSLEERIIPRCSVVQYLLSKKVLGTDDFNLNQALAASENDFFSKIVYKYEKTLPGLSEVYTQYKNGAVNGICQPVCSRDTLKYSKTFSLIDEVDPT